HVINGTGRNRGDDRQMGASETISRTLKLASRPVEAPAHACRSGLEQLERGDFTGRQVIARLAWAFDHPANIEVAALIDADETAFGQASARGAGTQQEISVMRGIA